jgi:glycosyltransferase involved in cell wall biosynthesis
MRIIFDANPLTLNKSGVGHYTHELIQSLADSHPDASFVGYYFNFGGLKQITGLPEAPNIQYHELRLIPGKVLGVSRRLGFQFPLQIFVREPADIVLSTNFVPTLKKRKAKRVTAVHDLAFIDCPQFVAERNLSFLQKWAPKAIKHADLILTISEFTKSRLMDMCKVPADKIHITPIPPASHPKSDPAILTKLDIGDGYLLFVGTIEPRKNIGNLVEAFALLPEELHHTYPLVLTGGKGWRDEAILARIEELQKQGLKIILTGYVTDAERAALYENATACVLPSHYEGFGMPVLEAMSYGKPVACSDIDVLHEVAQDAAVYFDKDKPQVIADCLQKLLDDPSELKTLSNRAKSRVAAYPTWKNVADSLYERLIRL